MILPDIKSGLEDRYGEEQPENNAVKDAQANIVDPPCEFGNRTRPIGS